MNTTATFVFKHRIPNTAVRNPRVYALSDGTFVRVATAKPFGRWETLVFRCDSSGKALNHVEIGGMRDVFSHRRALAQAGIQLRNATRTTEGG